MIRKDPVFKGCTRPAMLWGVPLVPMVVIGLLIVLLAFWIWLPLAMAVVPAVIVMRQIVANDDQQFRLLWLRAKCRVLYPNRNGRYWRSSAYGPFKFQRRNP